MCDFTLLVAVKGLVFLEEIHNVIHNILLDFFVLIDANDMKHILIAQYSLVDRFQIH